MKKLTCIMCPVGCELTIIKEKENILVTGNGCIRGHRYGIQEITNPSRIVTALVKTQTGICSVKTTNLIPKNKIKDVLKEIEKLYPEKVEYGEILIKNILNLDADIVVTRA